MKSEEKNLSPIRHFRSPEPSGPGEKIDNHESLNFYNFFVLRWNPVSQI